jgi:hypothetical protein
MYKNTGLYKNQLSNLDFPQVLQDSHNIPLHALDVNVVNSLIPTKYSKIEVIRDEFGNIVRVDYFGGGQPTSFNIEVKGNVPGSFEIVSLDFTGQTPSSLSGKYFILYDNNSSVGIWFNLNGITPQPVIPTSRVNEVIIFTGYSTEQIVSATLDTLQLDGAFSVLSFGNIVVLSPLLTQNVPNATVGTTNLIINVTDGIDSFNNKRFYLYSPDSTKKFIYWFNLNDTGNEPTEPNDGIYVVNINNSDTINTAALKLAQVINNNVYFIANVNQSTISISYKKVGQSIGFVDINSQFTKTVISLGSNIQIVATVLIERTECGSISSIEVV